MRAAVEAESGNVAGGIGAAGKIAGVKNGRNACDIALERQHLQIEVQFDVFVERFRNAGRNHDAFARLGAGGFLGDVEAALDFANVVGVFIETGAVAGSEILLEAGKTFGDRVQNAAVLFAARGTLFGGTAVSK